MKYFLDYINPKTGEFINFCKANSNFTIGKQNAQKNLICMRFFVFII